MLGQQDLKDSLRHDQRGADRIKESNEHREDYKVRVKWTFNMTHEQDGYQV
jgi:hypothetical protein